MDEDLEDVRKLLKVCTSVSLIVAGLMFVAGDYAEECGGVL